jgi:4-amino-4-deoxy-L-arabinose transferase-like glycosyltransferase
MLMTFLLISAYLIAYPLLNGDVSWRRTVFGGLVLGLAILTKGPVAAVLLALAAFIYLLLLRTNPFGLAKRVWPWAMAAIALGVAALWYVPAFIAGRSSDLVRVFIAENFGHFMPASLGGTGEAARPVYYIVIRLLGGALPLSFLIPALVLGFTATGFDRAVRKPLLFQLAMACAVVMLFSASSAKRDDYILPALPPLAILFAALFTNVGAASNRLGAASLRDLTAGAIAAVMFALVVAAMLASREISYVRALGIGLQSADASYLAIFIRGMSRMPPVFIAFVCAIAMGSAVTLTGLWRGHALVTGMGLAILCISGSLLWTGVLRPQEARTRSLDHFAVEVRDRVGDSPVYAAFDDPELAFYYGRAVHTLPREIARFGPPPGHLVYFVARPPELLRLSPRVRRSLVVVIQTRLLGGGGPPALYLMPPVNVGLSPADSESLL